MNVRLIAVGGKKDGMVTPVSTLAFSIGRDESVSVLGEEEHGHAVGQLPRQEESEPVGFGRKELMRELQQNARSVPRRFVGARRPAMLQIEQNLLAMFYNRVLPPPGDIDDRPDAAGVMFLGGIVESVGFR